MPTLEDNMPALDASPVPSAAIRSEIGQLEGTLAALHDMVSRTALATYAAPNDADLRREADQALASLRDANDRLQQLRGAVSLAEQQEADQQAAAAQADRQKAKDRLIRERDRLRSLAEVEYDKSLAAGEKLPDAEAELDELARQWGNQKIAVEVLIEQRDNASGHACEYLEQADALDQEIEAMPVTPAEVAALEEAQRAAEQAAADEARRQFDEDTAAELARIAGAQMIEVGPARVPPGEQPHGWRFSAGLVVAVPRKDLPEFEAAKARHAAAEAERAAAEKTERDRVALRMALPSGPMPSASLANAQAAIKRPAHFTAWTEGAFAARIAEPRP